MIWGGRAKSKHQEIDSFLIHVILFSMLCRNCTSLFYIYICIMWINLEAFWIYLWNLNKKLLKKTKKVEYGIDWIFLFSFSNRCMSWCCLILIVLPSLIILFFLSSLSSFSLSIIIHLYLDAFFTSLLFSLVLSLC